MMASPSSSSSSSSAESQEKEEKEEKEKEEEEEGEAEWTEGSNKSSASGGAGERELFSAPLLSDVPIADVRVIAPGGHFFGEFGEAESGDGDFLGGGGGSDSSSGGGGGRKKRGGDLLVSRQDIWEFLDVATEAVVRAYCPQWRPELLDGPKGQSGSGSGDTVDESKMGSSSQEDESTSAAQPSPAAVEGSPLSRKRGDGSGSGSGVGGSSLRSSLPRGFFGRLLSSRRSAAPSKSSAVDDTSPSASPSLVGERRRATPATGAFVKNRWALYHGVGGVALALQRVSQLRSPHEQEPATTAGDDDSSFLFEWKHGGKEGEFEPYADEINAQLDRAHRFGLSETQILFEGLTRGFLTGNPKTQLFSGSVDFTKETQVGYRGHTRKIRITPLPITPESAARRSSAGQHAVSLSEKAGDFFTKATIEYFFSPKTPPRACTALLGMPGALMLSSVHWTLEERILELLKLSDVMLAESASDSILSGRAGYLSALNALFAESIDPSTQETFLKRNVAQFIRKIARQLLGKMMKSGRHFALQRSGDFPADSVSPQLLFSDGRHTYLGAAHGVAGVILQILTSRRLGLVELSEPDLIDIRQTLTWMSRLPLSEQNFEFPAYADKERNDLTHWCHGWPGIIMCFCEALVQFSRGRAPTAECKEWLDFVLQGSDVVWSRGIIRKGVGLCHGIAGNGYSFLRIHSCLLFLGEDQRERLGSAEQLKVVANKNFWRAKCFLTIAIDLARTDRTRRKFDATKSTRRFTANEWPSGLLTGLAGLICFACDVMEPARLSFPGVEVRADLCPGLPVGAEVNEPASDTIEPPEAAASVTPSALVDSFRVSPEVALALRLKVIVADRKFLWKGVATSLQDLLSQLWARYHASLPPGADESLLAIELEDDGEFYEIGPPEFDELRRENPVVRLSLLKPVTGFVRKLQVGSFVFALNPKYSDGTRLREKPEDDANFNGVVVLNDECVEILEIFALGNFALVRKGGEGSSSSGWIKTRNLSHVERTTGLSVADEANAAKSGPASVLSLLEKRGVPILPVDAVTVRKRIGEGAFGVVFKGELCSHMNESVALKQVKSSGWSERATEAEKNALADLSTEASVLWRFPHKNIVRLFGAHFDAAGSFYLVMEYCNEGSLEHFLQTERHHATLSWSKQPSGGYIEDGSGYDDDEEEGEENARDDGYLDNSDSDLEEKAGHFGTYIDETDSNEDLRSRQAVVKRPSPPELVELLLRIGKDICRGMHCLHSQKVAHRDLAARNILINVKKGTVNAKIADVGMSHSIYAGEYESFTGLRPIRWSAPEVLVKGPEARFSLKSDVWSFGVVLWEMFSGGRLPYYQYPDTSEVVAAVVDRQETLSKPQATPMGVFAIMKKCWSRSGTERPDFAALYDEIKIVQRQSLTQSDDFDNYFYSKTN